MTVLAIVAGANRVIACASDSHGSRDYLDTGAEADITVGRSKFQPLSSRLPIAAGIFGLGESTNPAGETTTAWDVFARVREQLDATRPAPTSLEPVAALVAREMFATFGPQLAERERLGVAPPAAHLPGDVYVGAKIGGYVTGWAGANGAAECWFFLVGSPGVVKIRQVFRGVPKWHFQTSPGSFAADAAGQRNRERITKGPYTPAWAVRTARELVQAQIDARGEPEESRGVLAAGPIHTLEMSRGRTPTTR